jgi:hypothetical protein
MTDRELLELAAKAAGMTGVRYSPSFGMEKMIDPSRPKETGSIGHGWNPLTDDGDALRLAVKLKIAVTYPEDESCVRVWYGSMGTEPLCDDLGSDPYAATRRAITRVAAEIGKEIK